MVTRAGHSLPELIVAVTFLGVTMTAVSGAIFAAARWTEDAVAHQEAVRLAAETLDSLRAVAEPLDGVDVDSAQGLRVHWRVTPGGDLSVTVSAITSAVPRVTLQGRRLPILPTLPDP